VRVLGLVGFSKVTFLHNGGEGGDVDDGGFGGGRVVAFGEDIEVLQGGRKVSDEGGRGRERRETNGVEDTLVVVLVEEGFVSFRLVIASLLCSVRVFLETKFFGESTASFDFFADLLETATEGEREKSVRGKGKRRKSRREGSEDKRRRNGVSWSVERRGERKWDVRVTSLLVTLQSQKLTKLPRFELALRIKSIGVVDVRLDLLGFLC
jgi:hypothetical protein